MSIEVSCPACDKKLRTAEKYLGRRIKCPHCEQSVQLSHRRVSTEVAVEETEPESPPVPADPRWFVRNANDQRFGPAPKTEVDQWVREGRIDNRCQLRKEGWERWRWADQVYPGLVPTDVDSIASNEPDGNPFDLLDDSPNPFPSLDANRTIQVAVDSPIPPARPDSLRNQLRMTSFYVRMVTLYGLLGWPLACLFVFWPGVTDKYPPPSLAWVRPSEWVLLAGLLTFLPACLSLRYHLALRKLLQDPLQTRWRIAIAHQQRLWKVLCLIATAIFLGLVAYVGIGFIRNS